MLSVDQFRVFLFFSSTSTTITHHIHTIYSTTDSSPTARCTASPAPPTSLPKHSIARPSCGQNPIPLRLHRARIVRHRHCQLCPSLSRMEPALHTWPLSDSQQASIQRLCKIRSPRAAFPRSPASSDGSSSIQLPWLEGRAF